MQSEEEVRSKAMEIQERFLSLISPESQFHRLLDCVEGLHFFAKDRHGRMMFVSRSSLAHHGVKHEWEIVGKTDDELVPPHLANAFVLDDQWIYRHGRPMLNRVELWLNPQGVPDWYLTNKLPIFSRDREIIGVMGVLQSYEGRKRHLEPYLAIVDAVEYVSRNYNQPLRIADIAARCHLSVRQLERRFLEAFRMTPRQFIIHTRVQYACEALLQSRRSILEIALETGFNDQSAFTRRFHQHLGMTPLQYRRRGRSRDDIDDIT